MGSWLPVWLLVVALGFGCAPTDQAPAAAVRGVVLIVIDDVGVDRVGYHAEHPDPGRTPQLDALAARGVRFRQAWATPLCSPTRATILTGLLPSRTGLGALVGPRTGRPLESSHRTLPEALPGVESWALGKWHLSQHSDGARTEGGFAHFAGTLFNLGPESEYRRWVKVVDGESVAVRDRYATTDTADDTLAALQTLARPFFLYVAFHAAHTPYHRPPAHLTTYELPERIEGHEPLFHRAMVEALDHELGRILAELPPDVVVIVVGDNGTQSLATDGPFDPERAKGSVHQHGVRVPLVIAGPGVREGWCEAPVHTTDLFATVVELLGGAAAPPRDSVSLVPYLTDPGREPLREVVVTQRHPRAQDTQEAARDGRHKLIRIGEQEEFYDLLEDPWERVNLLEGDLAPDPARSYQRLRAALEEAAGSD